MNRVRCTIVVSGTTTNFTKLMSDFGVQDRDKTYHINMSVAAHGERTSYGYLLHVSRLRSSILFYPSPRSRKCAEGSRSCQKRILFLTAKQMDSDMRHTYEHAFSVLLATFSSLVYV